MTEPTITCPKCQSEIRLTESLAAPLRLEFEQRLAAERERMAQEAAAQTQGAVAELQAQLDQRNAKVAEYQKAQAQLLQERQQLADERAEMETTLQERLRGEREKLLAEAQEKARLSLQDDLAARDREMGELKDAMEGQRKRLAEAQQAQAELLRKQRELEDAKAQLALDVERGIQEGLEASRAQARKDAEEALGLELAKKQHTITAMQQQIEELKRKAEQGSQQLQGEVLELNVERKLAEHFPQDTITPVPKGAFGGDALQVVSGPMGHPCGTILWEFKNTKTWSDGWLSKLKQDQRAAKAEVAVLVSLKLPKGTDTFNLHDGVWVTSVGCLVPVAICLRQSLMELSQLRHSQEGQDTKMELVYDYLTGPRFRQRVQAIVESFDTMRKDLEKERKAMTAQWAKRETQLNRVLTATAGMYGDLQGIAGPSLQVIQELDLEDTPLLEELGE